MISHSLFRLKSFELLAGIQEPEMSVKNIKHLCTDIGKKNRGPLRPNYPSNFV